LAHPKNQRTYAQTQFSLVSRQIDTNTLDLCAGTGLSTETYIEGGSHPESACCGWTEQAVASTGCSSSNEGKFIQTHHLLDQVRGCAMHTYRGTGDSCATSPRITQTSDDVCDTSPAVALWSFHARRPGFEMVHATKGAREEIIAGLIAEGAIDSLNTKERTSVPRSRENVHAPAFGTASNIATTGCFYSKWSISSK
jgi:hypothetical protein